MRYKKESVDNSLFNTIKGAVDYVFSDLSFRTFIKDEENYSAFDITVVLDGFNDLVYSDDYKVFKFNVYLTFDEPDTLDVEMTGPDQNNEYYDPQKSLASINYRPENSYFYMNFDNLYSLELYQAKKRVDLNDNVKLLSVLKEIKNVLESKIDNIINYKEAVESGFEKVLKNLKIIENL